MKEYKMVEFNKIITEAIPKRLQAHGWGTCTAPATFNITDVRGLHLAAGAIRYALNENRIRLYYRGQTNKYPAGIVPSLYRGAQTIVERNERDEKLNFAIDLIKGKAKWDPNGIPNQSEALAQHYGLRTRCIDVVDHMQAAAWFAYHQDDAPEDASQKYSCIGYIYLIAIPEKSDHAVADLRERGSNWLRPHIQQSFSIVADALRHDLNDCVVATFILSGALLRSVSGYEFYTKNIFFPPRGEDQGRYFWSEAAQVLRGDLSKEDFDLLVWSDGT